MTSEVRKQVKVPDRQLMALCRVVYLAQLESRRIKPISMIEFYLQRGQLKVHHWIELLLWLPPVAVKEVKIFEPRHILLFQIPLKKSSRMVRPCLTQSILLRIELENELAPLM